MTDKMQLDTTFKFLPWQTKKTGLKSVLQASFWNRKKIIVKGIKKLQKNKHIF